MQFGKYQLLKKIGTGGMAEVFLARECGLAGFERLVCIKRILPHLSEQTEFITMFKDEARIAANLNHPNIVQIYDLGEINGVFYIAMELLKGQDIRDIYNAECARKRPIPFINAAQIIYSACNGLSYAHASKNAMGEPIGLVHRDISPQNILVTFDGSAKILDFGVAKAKGKMTETKAGVLKGKYSYMSPEQANGKPIDKRSDIFALGIVLYEITTGGRLFKKENDIETLHAVMNCRVPLPSKMRPDYPPALEAIVMKALAAKVEDRYQDCSEFAEDLEKFIVANGGSTSQQALAKYMQELFADKIADDPYSPDKLAELIKHPYEAPGGGGNTRTPTNSPVLTDSTVVSGTHRVRYGDGVVRNSTTTRVIGPDGQEIIYQDNYIGPSPLKEKLMWAICGVIIVFCLGVGFFVVNKHQQQKNLPTGQKLDQILSQQAQQAEQINQISQLANSKQPVVFEQPRVVTAPETAAAANQQPAAAKEPAKPVNVNGTLSINGGTGWYVSINGKERVQAGQRHFSLAPGFYKLKFTHNQGATYSRNKVEIKTGKETEISLPQGRGSIFVMAKPFAEFRIGNSEKMQTPAGLSNYQAGDYLIHSTCSNGKELTKTITVTDGNTSRVVFDCN